VNLTVTSFESIVGTANVSPWDSLESTLQTQIFRAIAPPTPPACLVYPATQAELAEVVACAARDRLPMLIFGSGSKLHWGGLAEGVEVVISTARLSRLVDHAVGDLTVTAEAGMRLTDLQATLQQTSQFLAIDPAYATVATLGGLMATADTGALRQRYGGVRDMLIGFSYVRSDGEAGKAGGRVVKNVAGYDLMKLFTGSYGTLGVISQVTFRIYPQPPTTGTVVLSGTASAIASANRTLLASALTPTATALIDAQTVNDLAIGSGMGLVTRFQSSSTSVEKQSKQLLQVGQALELQGMILSEADERTLWQQLRERMEDSPNLSTITCKIGLYPAQAIELLTYLETLAATHAAGVIYSSSGIGTLRFSDPLPRVHTLSEIRQFCQARGGFLTVLAAPLAYKQQMETWGYPGNALDVMKRLKHQFDSHNLFSPGRFINGI
jgi:glycolate oxidase FAD binding subunit